MVYKKLVFLLILSFTCYLSPVKVQAEDWLQFKYDSRHSGDVPDRSITTPLGLVGAVPLSDGIFTAPVVKDNKVYVVDGSGVAYCIDANTLEILWKFESPGGNANCNNVSSPAIAGNYLHFGTMTGSYFVLDLNKNGALVKRIQMGDPIFSAPVVSNNRVYVSTLGAIAYSLEYNGEINWTWDIIKWRLIIEEGPDRWDGKPLKIWDDRKVFFCTRDIAAKENIVVIPAGFWTVFLEDTGSNYAVPKAGWADNSPFGISIAENGDVYRQMHRWDNASRLEIQGIGKQDVIINSATTGTSPSQIVGYSSASLRGAFIYRTKPAEENSFCRHTISGSGVSLGGSPSIASPILLKDAAVYGGLDGKLNVVPLDGSGNVWTFDTPRGRVISAPVAVCDGKVYFGCDDGYLYILGAGGNASIPNKDPEVWKIKASLTGDYTDPKYNWHSAFADMANTNSAPDQGVKPPFKIKWIKRFSGSMKHNSSFGGGRMYTHTTEGIIIASEQETGRQLWRRHWPGVTLSHTGILYYDEKVLVPQAGYKGSMLRCLDARNGDLLWEAPFSGTPGWTRQQPPVVYNNLAIYMYADYPIPIISNWLGGGGGNCKAIIRAWNFETGKEAWTQNFDNAYSGGDISGLCLMGDTLYYSGHLAPSGITAALNPNTGDILWYSNLYYLTDGCTISGKDGQLYVAGRSTSGIVCLKSGDGSLIWRSQYTSTVIRAVTIADQIVTAHSQRGLSVFLNPSTGKTLFTSLNDYKCTNFTLSYPYVFGCDINIYQITGSSTTLIHAGPRLDPSQCIGGTVSNGRLFYTSQGSGILLSLVYGDEAESFEHPWEPSSIEPRGNISRSAVNLGGLLPSYPKPFTSSLTIPFNIDYMLPDYKFKTASIRIYDVHSRIINEISLKRTRGRAKTVVWDGKNSAGAKVPSGTYFYRLVVDGKIIGMDKNFLVK
ncbi:MAG: PQQ-binding-like beta-propeller repeat protein [bacterium]